MIDLTPAAAQRHASLTIYPLLSPNGGGLGCVLLPDAIRAGTLRITEVGQGTVPELIAINTGDTDVLVLDGEQLIGAKQNRMASRSILLPAHSETKIPVSCMEHGRWHFRSREFKPSEYHSPSTVRRKHRTAERRYAMAGLSADPTVLREAQGPVWDEIAFNADALSGRDGRLRGRPSAGPRHRGGPGAVRERPWAPRRRLRIGRAAGAGEDG